MRFWCIASVMAWTSFDRVLCCRACHPLRVLARTVANIHAEEDMLGWSTSDFNNVVENRRALSPFFTLWHTYKELDVKHNRWTKGPVFPLDADAVAADSERIWRAMAKLVRTLKSIAPAALRVAETALAKVPLESSSWIGLLEGDCWRLVDAASPFTFAVCGVCV